MTDADLDKRVVRRGESFEGRDDFESVQRTVLLKRKPEIGEGGRHDQWIHRFEVLRRCTKPPNVLQVG